MLMQMRLINIMNTFYAKKIPNEFEKYIIHKQIWETRGYCQQIH